MLQLLILECIGTLEMRKLKRNQWFPVHAWIQLQERLSRLTILPVVVCIYCTSCILVGKIFPCSTSDNDEAMVVFNSLCSLHCLPILPYLIVQENGTTASLRLCRILLFQTPQIKIYPWFQQPVISRYILMCMRSFLFIMSLLAELLLIFFIAMNVLESLFKYKCCICLLVREKWPIWH